VEFESLWAEGRGFPAIRDRWLSRAAGLGAPIAVKLGDDMFRGTFETIDNEGRLILRSGDGSARAVSAGDVHFGSAGTAGY
jgi:BirA family biotin operon repressor/biotin-[acetyl-CoA-carboxylase] ligase